MESIQNLIGVLTALVGAGIALSAFTRGARLHRRITRLHTTIVLMRPASSPVLERSLRNSLAELQSREALREFQRPARLFSTTFMLATVVASGALATSLLSYALPTLTVVPPESMYALAPVWLVVSAVTIVALQHEYRLEFTRKDFAKAFALGMGPSDHDLSPRRGRNAWDGNAWRAIAAAVMTTTAVNSVGASFGFMIFAVAAPERILYFLTVACSLIATAVSIYIQGHAPRVRGKDTVLSPWPSRSDFQGQR